MATASLKKLLTRFRQKSFLRDTMTISIGTVLSQAVSVLIAPALTRLFSPEHFGIFSLFLSLSSIPAALSCLSYETAIMLPRKDAEASHLLALCYFLTTSLSVGTFLFFRFFGAPFILALKIPQMAPYLWLVPLNLFAAGMYQALNYWCNRKKEFRNIAASRVLQSVGTDVSQIAGGLAGFNAPGLIWGQIIGQALATLALFRVRFQFNSSLKKEDRDPFSLRDMLFLAKRYKNFPLFSTWGTLMNIASVHITPYLLIRFFGTETAGLFFLCFQVINAPMSLVGTAIGQVFFQRASEQAGNLPHLVEKIVARLFLVIAVPFLLLALMAPWLFSWVFGAQWREAGEFVRVMTPLFFLQFITSPVSVVLLVLEKQKSLTVIQSLLMATSVASMILGPHLSPKPETTLLIYTAGLTTIYLVYFIAIFKYSSATLKGLAAETINCCRSLLPL